MIIFILFWKQLPTDAVACPITGNLDLNDFQNMLDQSHIGINTCTVNTPAVLNVAALAYMKTPSTLNTALTYLNRLMKLSIV